MAVEGLFSLVLQTVLFSTSHAELISLKIVEVEGVEDAERIR